MRRTMWVWWACLLGGLLVAAVCVGLQAPARAAERMAPAANPGDVVINEVAWAGHAGLTSDEWVELYNNTAITISLVGWRLYSSDGKPAITLTGEIPPLGYYLIERDDDSTVSDIPADWMGSFGSSSGAGLANTGEALTLTDHLDNVIDTANGDGGGWPAGTASSGVITYATMERIDPTGPDTDTNWASNNGITRNGLDANSNPINGTPKARNSCYQPPATPVADLSIAKSGPLTATRGSIITYRIALSNTGTATATGTLLTDTLPVGVTFITQTGPFTLLATEPLVWDAGDVLSGAVHAITVTAQVSDTASGVLVNVITATTSASETVTANNSAVWTTTLLPRIRLYALAPVNYGGSKEAAALVNLDPYTVSLSGWRLNDAPTSTGAISLPATATIGPGQILWLAQDADGFYPVWGLDADWAAQAITRTVPPLNGSWPGFTDAGEAAYLLDGSGSVVDALAYGDGSASQGWSGPAVPYKYAGYDDGQVLYRKLDQASGLPVPDTDTAADWAQDPTDPINGRKLRFPGWDLEALFFPAEITATANVTLAVAPDGAFDLVSQTIASAQHTLRVEAYTLESLALYQVISDRIRAGVVVTILLESTPTGGMNNAEKWIAQQLHNPPTSTIYFIGNTAARYRYQHSKFVLVDERLALVSTDNFGENGMPSDRKDNGTLGHRGFIAVSDSPGVIARLAEIFRRDCDPIHRDVDFYSAAYAPPANFTPLPPPDWTTYTAHFSASLAATADHLTVMHAPEHTLRDRDSLLGLLAQAADGDQIAVMQLNEPFTWTAVAGSAGLNPRLQALIAAARRGATVRILLDEYYDNGSNITTCLTLDSVAAQESLSLACRLVNVAGLGLHAKAFLVSADGERWVHLGSINGTETSNKANREVALQFRSPGAYEYLLAVFDHDWARAHGPMLHRVYLPLALRDHVPPADYPLISEVFINPDGDDVGKEWIELYNPGPDVSIAGWMLGDAINVGDYGDGRYAFPAGAQLLRGHTVVAASCATNFAGAYGRNPDYEWTNCDATVPDLTPVGAWDGFGLALGNESDEALLLNVSGALVDSVAWGGVPRVGVIPFTAYTTTFPAGASLRRYPPDVDRNDCTRDFYVDYSPSPGAVAGN